MQLFSRAIRIVVFVILLSIVSGGTYADESGSDQPVLNSRFGPLGVFDNRSAYGKGIYPEPFLIDDSDLEINELRFDWLHQEASGQNTNWYRAELEKGFGLATVELEVSYDYDTSRAFDMTSNRSVFHRSQGLNNINLGGRHPIYQFVSNDGFLDTTFGAAVEAGFPTNTPLSKHAEIVPKVFNDTRLGDHFTAQTVIGYSFLFGSNPDSGTQTLEYGFLFGWAIQHHELPLPDVEQFIPIFELQGNTLTNTHAGGFNSLVGDAAFRLNLKAIGLFQPRLGVGYVFPIDKGARDGLRWGVYTSLAFDF